MKVTIETEETACTVHGGKNMTIYRVIYNTLKGIGLEDKEIKEQLTKIAENGN